MTATEHASGAVRDMVAAVLQAGSNGLPPEVTASAALLVADCMAIAMPSFDEPEVRAFSDFAEQRSKLNEATLLSGKGEKIDRFWAAAVNAVAMTTAEFDGGSRATPCHAGLYTVPALLAEGEAAGASMRQVLHAVVLSYEITTRLADMWKAQSGAYPNLYTHAKSGATGAALARGLLMGLGADDLCALIDTASTFTNAGPRNQLLNGALVRNVWPGAAAWSGMMSVEWTGFGFTATAGASFDVFGGVLGLSADVAHLSEGIGERWEISNGYHRIHATHLFLSALVECLTEVREQILSEDALSGIETVELEIHADAIGLDNRSPDTSLSARFSVPHVAAATLVCGNAGPAAFARASLTDPQIASLRDKVTLSPLSDETLRSGKWPAAVRVSAGGRVFSAGRREALGGHGRPVPQDMVLDKIENLSRSVWPNLGAAARQLVAGNESMLELTVGDFVAMASATSGAGQPVLHATV